MGMEGGHVLAKQQAAYLSERQQTIRELQASNRELAQALEGLQAQLAVMISAEPSTELSRKRKAAQVLCSEEQGPSSPAQVTLVTTTTPHPPAWSAREGDKSLHVLAPPSYRDWGSYCLQLGRVPVAFPVPQPPRTLEEHTRWATIYGQLPVPPGLTLDAGLPPLQPHGSVDFHAALLHFLQSAVSGHYKVDLKLTALGDLEHRVPEGKQYVFM